MPWKMTWEPNPQNMHLKVHKHLPPGIAENSNSDPREAYGLTANEEWYCFHFCRHCKGWIEGAPQTYTENTLGPLSGRSGVAYYCLRCGKSIGFNGVVS